MMAYVICMTIYTTSAQQTRENSRFLSYHGKDNLGRTGISIPKENPGFPYLVCKKKSFSYFAKTNVVGTN